MIRFLIKKSFFDAWDNMLTIILLNVGFLISVLSIILLPLLLKPAGILPIILSSAPGLIILHICAGTASAIIRSLSDSGTGKLLKLRAGFQKSWKASIILAALNILIILIISAGIPVYMLYGTIPSTVAAVFILCLGLLWFSSIQFFYPFLYRNNEPFLSVLKKSVQISLDNPLFSFFVLFFSIALSFLSLVTFLFLPGISAVLLFQQNAYKLRLYKYDWYEDNPENRKKRIPWNSLLEEDVELLGKRTLKGMFFPSKE